jgi:hypothetical protein
MEKEIKQYQDDGGHTQYPCEKIFTHFSILQVELRFSSLALSFAAI